jgi:hypothetical protein
MKVKLLILLLIVSFGALGQTTTNNQPWYFFKYKLSADSLYANKAFYAPIRDTNWTPTQVGALVYKSSDATFYGWNGTAWQSIGLTSGGSGTVTSVTLTAPTGFTITGSPVTTTGTLDISTTLNGLLYGDGANTVGAASVSAPLSYAAGTLGITQASGSTDGYLDSSDYDDFTTAYNKRPISLSVTGTATKTVTLNQGDGSSLSASFTDENSGSGSSLQNGRVSGGDVVWLSGYNYNVSPAVYNIDGVQYTTVSTDITLSAAHATLDRFDLFVLTTSGTAEVIEGTAAASPLTPNYNPATQLPLYYVLVTAASTSPSNVTQAYIYRENTEWTTAQSGGTFNANSAAAAYNGTKSVEATAVLSGHYVTFTTSATTLSYDNLVFAIKSKASWGSRRLLLEFLNSSNPVGSPLSFRDGQYGFSSTNTADWQIITIPLSTFAASGATVTALKITGSSGSGTLGFYMDDIQVQGVSQTPAIIENDPTVPALVKQIPVSDDAATDKFLNWDGTSYVRTPVDWSQVATKPNLEQSKSWTIESPSSTENIGLFYTKDAITITHLADVIVGSSTPSVTYQINHHTDRSSGSPNTLLSAGRSVTSASGSTTTSFNDATIPAGSWVWITTSATGGTITEISITLTYSKD